MPSRELGVHQQLASGPRLHWPQPRLDSSCPPSHRHLVGYSQRKGFPFLNGPSIPRGHFILLGEVRELRLFAEDGGCPRDELSAGAAHVFPAGFGFVSR